MLTETDDVEGELVRYLDKLESLGGIDLFFLGFGPEANAASHLCYIKPGSGARYNDLAGVIPISSSILEHHINKFKVGGSDVSEQTRRSAGKQRISLPLDRPRCLVQRR
jgi:6-phosphogluconolactonase/glucosamine-6-phosphate isomerase/deaminase